MAGGARQAASDVLNALNRLWGAGGSLSAESGALSQAGSFSATAQTVTYIPPTYVAPSLRDESPGASPTVSSVDANISMAAFSPRTIEGAHATGTTEAPVIGDVTIPDAPRAAAAPVVPPAPRVAGVDVAPAPTVDIDVSELPSLPSVPLAPALNLPALSQQTLQAINIPLIDASEIDAALDRLRSNRVPVNVPGYVKLIPEVFTAAGGLLAGDFVFDDALISEGVVNRWREAEREHDALLNGLWSGRGFDQGESAVPQYNAVMANRFEAQRELLDAAVRVRWNNDLLRAAYDVGVMAHAMAMDFELSLYDLRFAALTAYAEARLEMVKALFARYNADVLEATAAAVQYSAENEMIRARATHYRSQAQLADGVSQLNAGIADSFAATERAKGAEVEMYEARLEANEARLKALTGRNTALASQAEAAAVALEAYKGQVLTWAAGIERVKADYEVYSARVKGLVAQNRAQVAKAQLSGVRNEAVAAQAQKAAAESGAAAAQIIARATSTGAGYGAIEAKNTIEAVKARLGASSYQRQIMEWTAKADSRAGALEGWASAGAAAARFSVSAMESASRAAQITQEVSTKVAQAHATVAEALGKAKSSIEAGRYAGFKASVTLSGSGSIGESIGTSTNTGNSTSTETSYIDRYTY